MRLSCDGGLEVHLAKRAALGAVEPAEQLDAALAPTGSTRGRPHRLRVMLDEIDEGYAALDWEYRHTHVNRAAYRLLQLTPAQMLGRTPFELWPKLQDTSLGQAYREAMELGLPATVEYQTTAEKWFEARLYPTSTGLSVYFRDIDERKRKELERDELLAALRDSEERYRGLFQSESDALLVIDHESGHVLEANPAAAAMYGYPTEELLGLTDLDLSAEPELTRSTTRSTAVEANLTVPSRRHRRKDGTAFAVEMTGRVFSLQGRLVRVVAVRDVSARKRAEEALGRFQLLAANSRDIILFMDRDGRIIEANEAAERAYGYSRDELLELTIADLWAAPTQAEIASQMAEADERGILFESLHRRRDGSVFAVEVSSRGATVGGRRTLVSVVRDISERKRVEQALQASEERYRSIVELASERLAAESGGGLALDAKVADESAARRATPPDAHRRRQRLLESTLAQRRHPLRTLLLALLLELAYLVPMGLSPTRSILGMPGSLLALTVIVVGAIAGIWPGIVSALGGAAIFYLTVSGRGHYSSPLAVLISTGIWVTAAILSSLLADALLEQGTRRREAAVAFVQAETARREQSAELRHAQRIATTLQQHFLHPLPQVAGLELAELALPAGRDELIGGDFRDVIVRPDGLVVALVGDVTGKGIEAAGFTETVHSAVRTLALISPSPDYILGNVNRVVVHTEADHQLATALLVVLDPTSGRGRLASAGHPAPVLLSRGGCRILESTYGLPLGVLEEGYQTTEFELGAGEALLMYTDGVTEARRNGELFGESRLLEVLEQSRNRDPQVLIERLRRAVISHAGELKDDLQILVIRRT
jgi:PAS domain S-box-containing protein